MPFFLWNVSQFLLLLSKLFYNTGFSSCCMGNNRHKTWFCRILKAFRYNLQIVHFRPPISCLYRFCDPFLLHFKPYSIQLRVHFFAIGFSFRSNLNSFPKHFCSLERIFCIKLRFPLVYAKCYIYVDLSE